MTALAFAAQVQHGCAGAHMLAWLRRRDLLTA